jgi:hypothetical protein
MFKEGFPVAYEAPAYFKKWPSVNSQRLSGKADLSGLQRHARGMHTGIASKPIKQISLYDIVPEPQPMFDKPVLSPADAAEIAMRKDFPTG